MLDTMSEVARILSAIEQGDASAADQLLPQLGLQRSGGRARLNLEEALDVVDPRADEILHVHSALEALASESAVKADLVKLRYFCGLSHQEAAESLGLSRATADRYWAYAKAFLFAALRDDEPGQEKTQLR